MARSSGVGNGATAGIVEPPDVVDAGLPVNTRPASQVGDFGSWILTTLLATWPGSLGLPGAVSTSFSSSFSRLPLHFDGSKPGWYTYELSDDTRVEVSVTPEIVPLLRATSLKILWIALTILTGSLARK